MIYKLESTMAPVQDQFDKVVTDSGEEVKLEDSSTREIVSQIDLDPTELYSLKVGDQVVYKGFINNVLIYARNQELVDDEKFEILDDEDKSVAKADSYKNLLDKLGYKEESKKSNNFNLELKENKFKDYHICKGCGKPLSQCTCQVKEEESLDEDFNDSDNEVVKESYYKLAGYYPGSAEDGIQGDRFETFAVVKAFDLKDAKEKFRQIAIEDGDERVSYFKNFDDYLEDSDLYIDNATKEDYDDYMNDKDSIDESLTEGSLDDNSYAADLDNRIKEMFSELKSLNQKEDDPEYIDDIYDLQRDFYRKYIDLARECKDLIKNTSVSGYGINDFVKSQMLSLCRKVDNNFPYGWRPRNMKTEDLHTYSFYARMPGAPESEIIDQCKASSYDEAEMIFSEKYNTSAGSIVDEDEASIDIPYGDDDNLPFESLKEDKVPVGDFNVEFINDELWGDWSPEWSSKKFYKRLTKNISQLLELGYSKEAITNYLIDEQGFNKEDIDKSMKLVKNNITESSKRYTVELYPYKDLDPDRFRFDSYEKAMEFAKTHCEDCEEVNITTPGPNGLSVVNSYDSEYGWYEESIKKESYEVRIDLGSREQVETYDSKEDAQKRVDELNNLKKKPSMRGMKVRIVTNNEESLKEDYDDLLTDDEIYNEDEESDWVEIDHKMVYDSDGFTTDYTWYHNDNTGNNVFVFGDKELYRPEDGYYDFETEDDQEAQDWFDNYSTDYDDDDYDDDYGDYNDDFPWEEESVKKESVDSYNKIYDQVGLVIDHLTYGEEVNKENISVDDVIEELEDYTTDERVDDPSRYGQWVKDVERAFNQQMYEEESLKESFGSWSDWNLNCDITDDDKFDESLKIEDTVRKSNGKWTNRGKEGEHGEFDTKKQADAQRKAMYANGYKGESLKWEDDYIEGNKYYFLKDDGKTLATVSYHENDGDPYYSAFCKNKNGSRHNINLKRLSRGRINDVKNYIEKYLEKRGISSRTEDLVLEIKDPDAKDVKTDLSKRKGSITQILTDNREELGKSVTKNDLIATVKDLFKKNNLDTPASRKLIVNMTNKKSLVGALEVMWNTMLKGSGLGVINSSIKREDYYDNDGFSGPYSYDGWNVVAFQDILGVLNQLDEVRYEIENGQRGALTGKSDLDSFLGYIDELSSVLKNAVENFPDYEEESIKKESMNDKFYSHYRNKIKSWSTMAGIPDIREWLIDDLKDLENRSSSHNWGWDFSDGVESIADDLIKKAKKEFKWLHESSTKEESVEDNIYDMITDAADALDALDDDLKDDASDSIDKAIEDGESAKDGLSEDVTSGATNPSNVGQHKVDSIDLVEDGEMKLYKYQGPIYRRDNGTKLSDSETLYTKATSEKKAYNNLSFRLKKKGQELAGHEYMSIEEKKESDQVHSDEFQFTCPVCKEKFTSNEKFSKCPGCQSKLRINDVGGTEEVVD